MQALRKQYLEQGYIIIPDFLSSSELAALRSATHRVVEKTRSGRWPYRRVWGKQFPPFDTDQEVPDVWGVQHVMHPDLGERAFATWYASRKLVNVAKGLLGCEEDELQMGELKLLCDDCVTIIFCYWKALMIRLVHVRLYMVVCRTVQYLDQPCSEQLCVALASGRCSV